jgi:hypothetical protein
MNRPRVLPTLVDSVLAGKVRSLREYGLTLKAIAVRLSIAESTAHKLLHSK